MNSALCTCQAGFEDLLRKELEQGGFSASRSGPGWVLAAPTGQTARETGEGTGTESASVSQPGQPAQKAAANGAPAPQSPAPDLAFAHAILRSPSEFTSDSVNALAQQILDFFLSNLGQSRIEGEWPCLWQAPAEPVGLGRRASSVENAFSEQLRKRMSRIARLAVAEIPRQAGPVRGLFVRFVDFGRVFVSVEAVFNGQRRMADAPLAPSRSYLKVEEAYGILGCEPEPGETVADLGAAPGGWSYSAARRGARVIAVDNGPLKGGALGHPMISHVLEDAFGFRPENDEPFDWLFCDLVDEPHHVLGDLVTPWLDRRWCLKFIVNLKFGRVDPIALLAELRAPNSALSVRARSVRIRHLFHDREEFTVVGISA